MGYWIARALDKDQKDAILELVAKADGDEYGKT